MARLLLTDSTMPMNFCKAGIGCGRAMAEHLGCDVYMVEDVHIELHRLAEELPALQALLEAWPTNPVRELDSNLKGAVAAAIKARQAPGQHPLEDRGEIATVLYAERQRQAGELFDVITDDGYGKKLATDRGFELVTTTDLIFELLETNALTENDGKRVWRSCVSRRRWADFDRVFAKRTKVQR